jgi:flagellar biosynthesis protein FlhG
MRRATRAQRTVLEAYPSSAATQAFKNLATAADKWPVPEAPRGNVEFFMERLVVQRAPQLRVVQ